MQSLSFSAFRAQVGTYSRPPCYPPSEIEIPAAWRLKYRVSEASAARFRRSMGGDTY
jgi:hypothetical protein